MSYEHAEVMHPGGREEHLLIERLTSSQIPRQFKQPGLVAELVGRLCLRADVFDDLFSMRHALSVVDGKRNDETVLTPGMITVTLRCEPHELRFRCQPQIFPKFFRVTFRRINSPA